MKMVLLHMKLYLSNSELFGLKVKRHAENTCTAIKKYVVSLHSSNTS